LFFVFLLQYSTHLPVFPSFPTRRSSDLTKIEPAGFEDVVFVIMGVSGLAAESVLRLPAAKLGKRTFLLDTIDPDSLRAFDEMLRSEEHTSELQSLRHLVCRLLLEKKKNK